MFALTNVILSTKWVSQFSPLKSLHNRITSYPHTTSQVDATILSFALSYIVAQKFEKTFMGVNTTYWGMTSAFTIHVLYTATINGLLEYYNHENPWPKHPKDKNKPADEFEQNRKEYLTAQDGLDVTIQKKQNVEREIERLESQGKKTKEDIDLQDLKKKERESRELVEDLNKLDDHLKKEKNLALLVRDHITIEDNIEALDTSIETLQKGTELSKGEVQRLKIQIELISREISEVQNKITTEEGKEATAKEEYSKKTDAIESLTDLQKEVTEKKSSLEEKRKKLQELEERKQTPSRDSLSQQGPWDDGIITSLKNGIVALTEQKKNQEQRLTNVRTFYDHLIIRKYHIDEEEESYKKREEEAQKTSNQLQKEINEKRGKLEKLEELKGKKKFSMPTWAEGREMVAVKAEELTTFFSGNKALESQPSAPSQEDGREPPPPPERNIEEEINSLTGEIQKLNAQKKASDGVIDDCRTKLQTIAGSAESKKSSEKSEESSKTKKKSSKSKSPAPLPRRSHQAKGYNWERFAKDRLKEIPDLPRSTVDAEIKSMEDHLLDLAEQQFYDAAAKERRNIELKEKCEEGNKKFPKEIEALEAEISAEEENLRSNKEKLETALAEANICREQLAEVQKEILAQKRLKKNLNAHKNSLSYDLSQLKDYGNSSDLDLKNEQRKAQLKSKRRSLISQGQALKQCSEPRKNMLGRHRKDISQDLLTGIHELVEKSESKLEGLRSLIEEHNLSSAHEEEMPKLESELEEDLKDDLNRIAKALRTTTPDADADIDKLDSLSKTLAEEKAEAASKVASHSSQVQEARSKLSAASEAREEKINALKDSLSDLEKTRENQYTEWNAKKSAFEKEAPASLILKKNEELRNVRGQLLLAEKEHLESKKVQSPPENRILQMLALYELLMRLEPHKKEEYHYEHLRISAKLKLLKSAQIYNLLESQLKNAEDFLYFTLWLALSDLDSALELKRFDPNLDILQEFKAIHKRRTPATKGKSAEAPSSHKEESPSSSSSQPLSQEPLALGSPRECAPLPKTDYPSAYDLFFDTFGLSKKTIKEFIEALEDSQQGIATQFVETLQKAKKVKTLTRYLEILKYKAALVEEGFDIPEQTCKEKINELQLEQIESELQEISYEKEPWLHKIGTRRIGIIASAILSALTVTAFPNNIVKLTGANRVILWLTFTSFQSQAYMWMN